MFFFINILIEKAEFLSLGSIYDLQFFQLLWGHVTHRLKMSFK